MVFVGGELSDQTDCPAPNFNVGREAFPAVPAFRRTSCGQGVGKTSLSCLLSPQVSDNEAVGQGARQRGQGTRTAADGRSLAQYGTQAPSFTLSPLRSWLKALRKNGREPGGRGVWGRGVPGIMDDACNLSTQEIEAGGLHV